MTREPIEDKMTVSVTRGGWGRENPETPQPRTGAISEELVTGKRTQEAEGREKFKEALKRLYYEA